jgi:hypothetical protein
MKHSDAQLEQITARQMMFNTVYTHLRKQGKASVEFSEHVIIEGPDGSFSSAPRCKYRASDGGMCAVGVLMPDSKYEERFEGMGVLNIIHKFPEWMGQTSFLADLQEAHDSGCMYTGDEWKQHLLDKFSYLAAKWALDRAVLDL